MRGATRLLAGANPRGPLFFARMCDGLRRGDITDEAGRRAPIRAWGAIIGLGADGVVTVADPTALCGVMDGER
jgi:hypothetical protein